MGAAGGFVGGKIIDEKISGLDNNVGATELGAQKTRSQYGNDGVMSVMFQQMSILKQESDKIIATFKQQEGSQTEIS